MSLSWPPGPADDDPRRSSRPGVFMISRTSSRLSNTLDRFTGAGAGGWAGTEVQVGCGAPSSGLEAVDGMAGGWPAVTVNMVIATTAITMNVYDRVRPTMARSRPSW